MKQAPAETSCGGKSPFTDRSVAEHAAQRIRRRVNGCNAQAYHCQHCGSWHVGTSVGPKHFSRKPRRLDQESAGLD